MGIGTRTAITDTGPPLHLCEINQERQIALFELLIVSQFVRDELASHNVWDNGPQDKRSGETVSRRSGEAEKIHAITLHALRFTHCAWQVANGMGQGTGAREGGNGEMEKR
jgi:hypothetical protein